MKRSLIQDTTFLMLNNDLKTRRDITVVGDYSKSRTRQVIKFCDIPAKSIVLDIGVKNELSMRLGKEKDVEVINTTSDLDYEINPERYTKFNYVTCFEVIEHLLNPRLFLDNLHTITEDNVIVYFSYPSRPKWLWNNKEHFHEYDRLRFNYLLNKTEWRVINEKKIYYMNKINGIRPIIRNLIPKTTIYKLIKL